MLNFTSEVKNLQTENKQLSKVNEKLLDRIEIMTMLIEKEASAHTYMYNYPPKADAVLLDAKEKGESAVTKVKRQYEEMLET